MAIVEVKMLSGFNPVEGTRQQVRSFSSPHLISSIAWAVWPMYTSWLCTQRAPQACSIRPWDSSRHPLLLFPTMDGVLDCSRKDSRAYFREDLGHRVAWVFELLPGTFPL